MPLGLDDYKTMSQSAQTDEEKINFFDECIRAFFLDTNLTEFESALKCFIDGEGLTEEELDELETVEWKNMSDKFKLIAFQKCIVEGSAYQTRDDNNITDININNNANLTEAA